MSYNPWIDHLTHPQPRGRDTQVLAARQRRELAKAAAWFLFRIRAGMKRQNFTNIYLLPYDNTYLIYVGDNVL
jgi:hypothetical protein